MANRLLGQRYRADGILAVTVRPDFLGIGIEVGARVTVADDASLLARLHKLGPSFFRKIPTGDILSRATNSILQWAPYLKARFGAARCG